MSLSIAALNSGSNGNCYYIGNGDNAILIDAGISCRETEKRMKRLGLSLKNVKGIFVTHEHSDHIYGIPTLVKRFKIPVYTTRATLLQSRLKLKDNMVKFFSAHEPVTIGNVTVTPFPIHHDASDPHNFIISNETVKVGVFTDIGNVTDHVIRNFQQCHAAFLESNYDEELLETGRYPIALKNRIRNGYGHLSNVQAVKLFRDHRPPFMSHLFLGHLSQNNNSPKIVEKLFNNTGLPTEIVIATRYRETNVYPIHNLPPHLLEQRKKGPAEMQLSLFN